MTASARQDLDDFLQAFTDKLISAGINAVRAKDTNHLLFSPDAINTWGLSSFTPVLRAMSKFDVIHSTYFQNWTGNIPERAQTIRNAYDITGKPIVHWIGMTANADSSQSASPNPYGVDNAPNQAARGAKYASYITDIIGAQGSNGDYPSVGVDFWGWADMPSEKSNWGLTTPQDEAYDGKEAPQYGDFITPVTQANVSIYSRL
jgi:arabinogalactan endo-1,4-beta-galactosidase